MSKQPAPQFRWRWPQLVLANLVIVAAFLATGLASRGLDLPPGYAVPVFPPAGVSLALMVVAGWRMLPGVLLGALLQYLPTKFAGTDVATTVALAAATLSALGSTAQAWLGARYFRRLVRPALDSPRDVLRFVLLAPLVALLGASVSVPTFYGLGILSETELLPNWINWWAGDTIGILLAAPLCWIVCGRPRALWRRRAALVAVPLLLAAAAVVAMYEQAVDWEHEQHLQPFRLKAQQVADVMQAEFHEHERFVGTFASTLSDTERVLARDKFLRIASGYVDGRPEIAGINWAVPVTDGERAAFEMWAREVVNPNYPGVRDLAADGTLGPAATRAIYMPVLYAWPPLNRWLLGVDFLAVPERSADAARALRDRRPIASEPVRLLGTQRAGITLFRSVGEFGIAPVGVLILVLDGESFVRNAVQRSGFTGFVVALADVTVRGAPQALAGDIVRAPHPDDYQVALSFGGRNYLLRFSPSAAYTREERGLASWLVLTSGLLLTGLLGSLMLLISGERARIEGEVAERTALLRDREARLAAVLDNAADAIVTVDAAGLVADANAATAALFGYPAAHLPGLPFTSLVPAGGDERGPALLERLTRAPPDERELDGLNARGERFPLSVAVSRVQLPAEHLFVCILRDLTEQYRAQERIYRLAHHDSLTGLENRLALNLRLEQELAHARRAREPLAVLYIDLDHFKKINDSHGHHAGDQLLVGAAQRMKDLLRDVDTLARLGGDEFVILLGGPLTPDSVTAVAVRLVESLQQPYHLGGVTAHSGASVGVALFPDDGQDAATLLRHADTAMYAAKREGRNNFQFFSPAMNAATHEHLMLENRMWAALEHGGFEVHLQAQVELDTGRVIGAEVLLRWHDVELGDIEPSRFIPIAEESGLILPLGDWVLGRAMQLLAEWQREGLGALRLAVNLSARQFSGGALLARLDALLAQHRINPARLELEITETAAMHDPENTRQLLRQLRARGFKLAIDDFGTGYSSLAYLKLFAIDRIKIDRGFVKDIETDPNDAAIVGATIGLAHSLGLTVVAEGVETQAQWGFLRDKHGDEAQGFLFGRPMPAREFREFLRTQAQPVPGP
jgi:diguanylate cyclase (GGDEF)-like protein/PAS domain S-box-containing protein